MGTLMKKAKSWDDYEKELFAKGTITEEEMVVEKLKMEFVKLLYNYGRHFRICMMKPGDRQ